MAASYLNLSYNNDAADPQYFPQLGIIQPFTENYLYRNFAYDASALNFNGRLTTGVSSSGIVSGYYSLIMPPAYSFQEPTAAWSTIASLLGTNQTRWLSIKPIDNTLTSSWKTVGVQAVGSNLQMTNNLKNLFGLQFLSTMVTSNGPVSRILNPGGTMRYNSSPYPYFYSETVQPQLTTVEYDFFNPGEIFDYGLQTWTKPVLPGMVFFSTSNHSQKFLAAVGSTIHIAGYAKMAIQNGNAGVYAYLGQYFTNAYKMDGNGNATTNTTGMVSPYGDFFATEPGQAAYITMPDLNTGVRGTCAVSCVSLNVDANHDGVMDVAFNGADRTSLVNPMRFWVNNGYTRANGDVQVSGDIPRNYSLGNMTGARDLENFARLWVCGMPTLVTNQGYAVTLNWQKISNSPAINLYASVETNGGTTYLTDTNIAAQQSAITLVGNPPMSYTVTGIGKAIAQITGGQTFTIPASYFTNSGNKYFLCEGAGIGSGELVLKILQNGTNILQTSVWLDLHDVKDLYEQADVTNVTTGLPPSSLVSQYRIDHVTAAAPDETKQVIVFVHGINNTQFDYSSSTETMFKRLYWSGYHGKVAGFKWPCAYLPFENSINPFNYNKGEFYAWKSASAFKDYLTYLHNRTDLTNYTLNILAHSQGNVVASEAVKQGAPFDNYILSQGAIPAQCYDTSVSFQQKFLTAEAGSQRRLIRPMEAITVILQTSQET